jgi:hypothetical protein
MPDLTPDPSLRRPPPSGVRDAVVRAGRRRRHRLLGAGVLVLAVVTAVPVAALFETGGEDSLLAVAPSAPEPCPAQLPVDAGERSVVVPPSVGPPDRLVPAQVPTAALVCRYGDSGIFGPGSPTARPASVALEGERTLTAGLERVPDDLALPAGSGFGFCTDAGGPMVPHLVRFDYPAGPVWVSTSTETNSCAVVTNGAFTAAVYVGDQVAASFDASAWVDDPPNPFVMPEDACPRGPTGRAGQERAMVPDGWDEVVVCRSGEGQPERTARTLAPEPAAAVVRLLNGLPQIESEFGGSGASCDQRLTVPGDDGGQAELVVGYPAGRAVRVIPFVGCEPPIGNGSLSATATAEQQAELLRLLEGD